MSNHLRMSNPAVPAPAPENEGYEFAESIESAEFNRPQELAQHAFALFLYHHEDLIGIDRIIELLDRFDSALSQGEGIINFEIGKGLTVNLIIEKDDRGELTYRLEKAKEDIAKPVKPTEDLEKDPYSELADLFDYALDDKAQAPEWLVSQWLPCRADFLTDPMEYFSGFSGNQNNPRIIQAKAGLNFFLLKQGLRPILRNSSEDIGLGLALMSNNSFSWSPPESGISVEVPNLIQSNGVVRIYSVDEAGESVLNDELTKMAQGLIFYTLSASSSERPPRSHL